MKHFNAQVVRILFFTILFTIFSASLFAQSIKIDGRVIDEAIKAALEGVSVTIKNSNAGTSTNAAGDFSLEAPANSKLLVTFIGYQSKEVRMHLIILLLA
ncbi:MAG: carboxypeptidase-like regulatory domain-containing protein [Ginsengibacter sp.]